MLTCLEGVKPLSIPKSGKAVTEASSKATRFSARVGGAASHLWFLLKLHQLAASRAGGRGFQSWGPWLPVLERRELISFFNDNSFKVKT